jgi:hypothetical protein
MVWIREGSAARSGSLVARASPVGTTVAGGAMGTDATWQIGQSPPV